MNGRPLWFSYPASGVRKGGAFLSRLDATGAAQLANVCRWLQRLPVALAVLAIVLLFCDGVRSLNDPFFSRNECWQGLQLIAATRVLEGVPLYPDVRTEASYYSYSPGVPILHAAILALFGKGVLAPKILSLLFCGLSLAGVATAAYGLTHSRSAAWVAAGLFAATYRFLAGWHFLIRPDVFAGAFAIWGMVLWADEAQHARGRFRRDALAGLLFLLATWCKQNYLILIALHLGFLAGRRDGRYAFRLALLVALAGLVLLGPYLIGNEHFLSTSSILARHPFRWTVLHLHFYRYLTDSEKTLLLLLAIKCLLFFFRSPVRKNWKAFVWVGSCVFIFAVSTVVALKWGSDVNSYYLFCLLLGLPLVRVIYGTGEGKPLETQPGSLYGPTVSLVVSIFLTTQVFAHLLPLTLYPTYSRPESPNLQQLHAFIQEHRDARLYCPAHNYLTWLGAGQYWHCDLMTEAMFHADWPAPPVLLERIEQRQFDYILGGVHTYPVSSALKRHYRRITPSPVPGFDIYFPKPSN